MIFLTSDIHGKTRSLMKLLEKANFFESKDNELYIIGDVVDRNGDGGIGLLKWLMLQPNCHLICGNHEMMMLANEWLISEISDESLDCLTATEYHAYRSWKKNGADNTIEALKREPHDVRADIFRYLKDLSLYEFVEVNGQKYLLVHGGLGDFEAERPIDDYTAFDLVWTRPSLETRYSEDFITVIGHTPTLVYGTEYAGKMIKTDTWWNIDAGAAAGLDPMLLCLDTMTEYYCDEI